MGIKPRGRSIVSMALRSELPQILNLATLSAFVSENQLVTYSFFHFLFYIVFRGYMKRLS